MNESQKSTSYSLCIKCVCATCDIDWKQEVNSLDLQS